ncbi:MAG: flagellar basal body P-ring formation chaperone FlgA [Hyphomicrobiales bacterium]|nr:flagellar basal body P-ring formation chaperone FlgA [Hyphomicrobiales bacterium]
MKRSLAALYFLSLTSLCSAAADRPVLKGNLIVAGTLVTLGDLIENAGINAGEALFHAPDIGAQGTIQTWRIVEAARSLGVQDIDTRNLQTVRIERTGRTASSGEIADALAQEFMTRSAIADRNRVVVQLDAGSGPYQFDAPLEAPLLIENLTHEPTTGRFEAALSVRGTGKRSRQVRISGVLTELVDALRLRRTVGRGEVITPGDVTVERIARNRAGADLAATLGEVVGLAPRRSIAEGLFVRSVDLEKPRVIARNDSVTIVLETPHMVLSVRGRAVDGGAVGDVIDVQNINSKRVVQATILGPGKVTARLSTQRQTASAAAPQPLTTP